MYFWQDPTKPPEDDPGQPYGRNNFGDLLLGQQPGRTAQNLAAPDPDAAARAAEMLRNKTSPFQTPAGPSSEYSMPIAPITGQVQYPANSAAVPSAAPVIRDGFHGPDGNLPALTNPMQGERPFVPGAGYAMSVGGQPFTVDHPNDSLFNSGPRVPHVWTEADLEPTSVLGSAGGRFTPDSRGYTSPSPSLPLFRADQASQAQHLNFAAEMANSIGRMNFQAGEAEKDRALKREIDFANNSVKKDVGLGMASDKNAPPEMRMTKIDEMAARKDITPQQASSLRVGTLLDQAKGAGLTPDSGLDFYKYVSSNFDDKKMLRSDLISKLQQMNVPSFDVEKLANPAGTGSTGSMALGTLRHWFGMDRGADEVRARDFARSLLMPK